MLSFTASGGGMIQFPISCGYLQMGLPLHSAFTFTLWEKIHLSAWHLKGTLLCSGKKKKKKCSPLQLEGFSLGHLC